jgi:hypothetical protein
VYDGIVRALAVVLVVLTGCGRWGFDETANRGDDASGDDDPGGDDAPPGDGQSDGTQSDMMPRLCTQNTPFAGYCWKIATDGDTCNDAGGCASAVDLDPIVNYVGSGGSHANCVAVFEALGFQQATEIVADGVGFGCYIENGEQKWDGSVPTSPGSAGSGVQRVCACTN